jgi:hypothetical protein
MDWSFISFFYVEVSLSCKGFNWASIFISNQMPRESFKKVGKGSAYVGSIMKRVRSRQVRPLSLSSFFPGSSGAGRKREKIVG